MGKLTLKCVLVIHTTTHNTDTRLPVWGVSKLCIEEYKGWGAKPHHNLTSLTTYHHRYQYLQQCMCAGAFSQAPCELKNVNCDYYILQNMQPK